MPVTQLTDQGGIGSLIGMAGAYLLGNPERKAKKAQAEYQQGQDKIKSDRDAAAAVDTHNRITSEIAANTAKTADTAADRTKTEFQQGAYAKLSGMLNSPPPQGTTAQQWVTHVQQQVPTLGLTDPNLLTKLYGEAQTVLAKDQTASATKFLAGEHALPSDPAKRLSTLMKRLQIERGQPGVDTKATETMIADTQKQIADAETRAYQATTTAERARHDKVLESQGGQRIQVSLARGAGGGGGYNSSLGGRAGAIEAQAMGAKDLKSALKILEGANLPRRDRTEVRQDIMDQFKAPPMSHDTSGLSSMGNLQYQKDVRDWMLKGQDPDSEPDPTSAKYPKKAAALGGNGGGAPPAAKPVMHNGKPYYLHSDGNYYLTT